MDEPHKARFYRIYLSGHQKFQIGEKMIVRTSRSRHFIRTTVIALCLSAAYAPVVVSQETKKDADPCSSSSDTAFPCPSSARKKEIPETPGRQAPNLPDAPQPQGQNKLPGS